LYTPLPAEQVLEGSDKNINMKEINYKGVMMQVEVINERDYKIMRIISSDPNDYLNPELQPGKIIKNFLNTEK
jgi:hypothetical protein